MNRKTAMIAVLILCTAVALLGCNSELAQKTTEDEITLKIKLDIKEDIGLLIVDYEANGSGGSGGTSNADKSLLRHDDVITYTLEKRSFDNPENMENLSLRFTVITEYVDPNYENIYPPEYTIPMDAISLDAAFGEAYAITITGDRTNGYTAILDK